jgi:hypothetical protein
LATEITGNEAAMWPAWNALWFNTRPAIDTVTSAYGCQCPSTPMMPSKPVPNSATVDFVSTAVRL